MDAELNIRGVTHTENGLREAGAGSHPATQPPRRQPDALGSWCRHGTYGHSGLSPGKLGCGKGVSRCGSGMPAQLPVSGGHQGDTALGTWGPSEPLWWVAGRRGSRDQLWSDGD